MSIEAAGGECKELFPEKKGREREAPVWAGAGGGGIAQAEEGRVKNQALRAAWEATGGFIHRGDIIKVSIRSTPSINSIKADPFPVQGHFQGGLGLGCRIW